MISPIYALGASMMHPMEDRVTSQISSEAIKDEFYAMFLREILKKSFNPSINNEDEETNPLSMPIVNDVLIDKLSIELAEQLKGGIPNF